MFEHLKFKKLWLDYVEPFLNTPKAKKRIFSYYNKLPPEVWTIDFTQRYFMRYIDRKRKEKIIKLVLQILRSIKRKVIVCDLGCGNGIYLREIISQTSFTLGIGIDISKNAFRSLSIERKKKERIQFVVGDIEDLPIKNCSVDLVICTETLEHLLNVNKALNEISRILKPNGILILSIPTQTLWELLLHFFHSKEVHWEHIREYCALPTANRKLVHIKNFLKLLKKNDLHIKKVLASTFLDFPLYDVLLSKLEKVKIILKLYEIIDEFFSTHLPFFGHTTIFLLQKSS